MTKIVSDTAPIIEDIIQRVGRRIVVGTAIGLGKPNQFINALYSYAKAHPEIDLVIVTGLSLSVPELNSDLEKRFAQPLLDRLFDGFEPLDFIRDIKLKKVPDNVEIREFYFKPGEFLSSVYAQRHYISTNYTHVARDLMALGVNVVTQMVAKQERNGTTQYSLSANPDVSLDLLDIMKKQGKNNIVVALQVHDDLPFMGRDAMIDDMNYVDYIIENKAFNTTLFNAPNGAVGHTDYLIGLYASTLIKDNGTLQIGIGSMSDAIVKTSLIRHQQNEQYQALLTALDIPKRYGELIAEEGGTAPFEKGLYGCSEMFVNGFRHLIDAGIIKRCVYDDLDTQLRANQGEVINEDGIFMHGGFFLGPKDFYAWLNNLPEETKNKICMSSVGKINQLTHAPELFLAQRTHARFINSGLMAMLNGSVASDGLEDGRVISGVGGQYNFVAMAHELQDARSILAIRATRGSGKQLKSNVLFNYGHVTIPRHLRDIVITEYGIADLRGKSDQQVYKAMLNITDSRFQNKLLIQAKQAKKIEADYEIPKQYRHNTPEHVWQKLKGIDTKNLFPVFPLGHDFTDIEYALLPTMKKLKSLSGSKTAMIKAVAHAWFKPIKPENAEKLARMGLSHPSNLKEKVYAKLINHL